MSFFKSRVPAAVTLLLSGLLTGLLGSGSYFSADRAVLDPSLFRMTVLFGAVMMLHSFLQILGAIWFLKAKEAGYYIAASYAVFLNIMMPIVYFRTGDTSIFLIDGVRGGILLFFIIMYAISNRAKSSKSK